MLGFDNYGSGARGVIILNDWLCDTSTWDHARRYLNGDRYSWAFVDLRGYGRSMSQRGDYTALEAAHDVLEMADTWQWSRFVILGHSMSSLVAMHLAQHHASRIEKTILLNPPPPAGFGVDDAALAGIQATATGDDAARSQLFKAFWGAELGDEWVRFKIERWRATSQVEAVKGYAAMYARDGVQDPKARINGPVLALSCEHDGEIFRRTTVQRNLSPLCDQLSLHSFADCGHYPMQEEPPRLAALVQGFIAE